MTIHRIVNSVFHSCTYIVYEEWSNDAFIVDCVDVQPIKEYLQRHNLKLAAVLLTHSHFDHIYGLPEIAVTYPHAVICTSENGVKGLKEPKLNISRYHIEASDISFESEMIHTLYDGEVNFLAGMKVAAILTPGHDWSCISYLCNGFLFTGDSYIPGTKVVTKWPKSNRQEAQDSWEKLKSYELSGVKIMAGHYIL